MNDKLLSLYIGTMNTIIVTQINANIGLIVIALLGALIGVISILHEILAIEEDKEHTKSYIYFTSLRAILAGGILAPFTYLFLNSFLSQLLKHYLMINVSINDIFAFVVSMVIAWFSPLIWDIIKLKLLNIKNNLIRGK